MYFLTQTQPALIFSNTGTIFMTSFLYLQIRELFYDVIPVFEFVFKYRNDVIKSFLYLQIQLGFQIQVWQAYNIFSVITIWLTAFLGHNFKRGFVGSICHGEFRSGVSRKLICWSLFSVSNRTFRSNLIDSAVDGLTPDCLYRQYFLTGDLEGAGFYKRHLRPSMSPSMCPSIR